MRPTPRLKALPKPNPPSALPIDRLCAVLQCGRVKPSSKKPSRHARAHNRRRNPVVRHHPCRALGDALTQPHGAKVDSMSSSVRALWRSNSHYSIGYGGSVLCVSVRAFSLCHIRLVACFASGRDNFFDRRQDVAGRSSRRRTARRDADRGRAPVGTTESASASTPMSRGATGCNW